MEEIDEDTFTFFATILAEREKSYYVRTDEGKQIWIPKSRTTVGEEGAFTIPMWLAEAKKLLEPVFDLNDIFRDLFQYIDTKKITSKEHLKLYNNFKKLIELEELRIETEKKKHKILFSMTHPNTSL